MRDIFANLYNKVFGFFQKQDEKEDSEHAKDIARNRLKLVLMQDRTNLTPYLLEKMRGEMIEVLSKYVEMDKDALELNFEQEGDSMALMLSIPVLRAKEDEEIQAVIEKQAEADDEKADYKKLYEELKTKVEKENKCIICDCEYKETDMECDKCPKSEECECIEECICDTCDCEYKESEIECEECPKSETCECYAEFKEECTCDETCDCGCQEGEPCTCDETCECGCQDGEECSCDETCDCGCQEGEPCTCDNKEQEEKQTKKKKNKK